MPKSLRIHEVATPETVERPVLQSVKKSKHSVLLITEDDSLWPQVGADLDASFVLKQLDSVDELIRSIPSAQAAIVLWDARNHPEPAAVLSRLNLHSSRFALVALDDAGSAEAWALPIQHRQVVAHLALPIVAADLSRALDSAQEEVNSRLALLGDGSTPPASDPAPKRTWLVPVVIGGVLIAAVGAYMMSRQGSTQVKPAPTPTPIANAPSQGSAAPVAAAPVAALKSPADADEKVDALIEKAQQAMLDRHFIDPVAGSALSLYREVLVIKPDNGEARQGLQRLSEILIARVQSALDERKFDVALQFLETARSIDANDKRLVALDEKIANLRAELGPAQILAALNAQNFDRATQLIDEAARTKALPPAKLAQLREEVHRRLDEFEVSRLLKLADTRLQQDHVIDPHNDSAVYYLEQAKEAGAAGPALQSQTQEVLKRLTQMAHSAIQQRSFSDADRILTELHGAGAPPAAISSLQRDLNLARNQQTPQKLDQPQYLDLAQSRLAQGKLIDPDNDSALFYVAQLRAADPKNSGLAQISATLQSQILDRAGASLDTGDVDKADALVQKASTLGASPDLDAMNDKIRQKRAGGEMLQMPEQSLTRLNKLDVQYPPRALVGNVEGWVELAYTVGPSGNVSNVKVLGAAPPRTFESSASKAVSRLHYQPVIQGGKAISVGTQVRIVYRVPK
jgi:periplasmic protein TonB